ncbi:prepilin-type N-terminal cleavage/methylation domain-containing protein [Candidatus Saccharibacteria bacterium]|nr:prepilin-type N-terminal cleavage/methylation domain-containing protein [Candidatus Saccharibacteria bacterium]
MWAQKVQPGFTIVELLIVIVVIAILATVTIIGYNGVSQQARASAVQSDLAQAVRKIELAKVESGIGMYPASLPSGRKLKRRFELRL